MKIFNIRDKFTQEILEIWAELHFRSNLESFADFWEQDLWNNSLIRIDNSPVFFEKWKNIGVCKVKHLLENPPYLSFFNHKQFQLKYEIKTPYLKFLGLISSVYCLQRKINSELGTIKQENKSLIQNTISGVSSSKDFYKSFVKNLGTKPETTQSKWGKDCNKEDLRWEKIYSNPFECSNSSKLRNFQFKLLHRRIATNSFLQKLGIKDTNLCTFCMKETETLTHLFWKKHVNFGHL